MPDNSPSGKPGHLAVDGQWIARFRQWGLTNFRAYFDLPGEIVSGHCDRQVVRISFTKGKGRVTAYLKREHRVRWRDRLGAWVSGFGNVSLSRRESGLLHTLHDAGVPVPKPLACGESGGRAFLLVRSVVGTVDLRTFLARAGVALPTYRRATLANRIGEALARAHAAGYDSPDLLSKHILVHKQSLKITMIDWARSRKHLKVPRFVCARDLARLHASLAGDLASIWDRMRCLRAYWRGRGGVTFCAFRQLIRSTRWAMPAAMRRRSIRELRQSPTAARRQCLRWVEGEALVATKPFARICGDAWPPWLTSAAMSPARCESVEEHYWNHRRALLHRWPAAGLAQRVLARLRGRRVDTALTRQAGLLFRLERYGIAVPRILAFGRRNDGSGFLLTRPPRESRPLSDWLQLKSPRRPCVLRRFGVMIARLHDAGSRVGRSVAALHVRAGCRPMLASACDLKVLPRRTGRWPLSDLGAVLHALGLGGRDAASLVRGYLGDGATREDGRELAESLRGELPEPRESHGA